MNNFSLCAEGLPPGNTYQSVCNLKSTEVDCISNLKELMCIFQNDKNENDTTKIPTFGFPPLWLIHIHRFVNELHGVYNNGVTTNSSGYCKLSDSGDVCTMYAVYSQAIFDLYPAALLACLIPTLEYFGFFQRWLSKTLTETSFTVPLPFCSRHSYERDFVQDVSDLLIDIVTPCTYWLSFLLHAIGKSMHL